MTIESLQLECLKENPALKLAHSRFFMMRLFNRNPATLVMRAVVKVLQDPRKEPKAF